MQQLEDRSGVAGLIGRHNQAGGKEKAGWCGKSSGGWHLAGIKSPASYDAHQGPGREGARNRQDLFT